MNIPPHFLDRAEWIAAYDAEQKAIQEQGQPVRRDIFNAEYPAPWSGPVTASSDARFAAICDAAK
jgi:hypothetical protein